MTNNWIVLAVTILIMIVQEVIMPRLKIRFCIYILPTVSFIAGIIFTIFSQNSLLTKVIMAAAVMLLSIIILLMGGKPLQMHGEKNVRSSIVKMNSTTKNRQTVNIYFIAINHWFFMKSLKIFPLILG
ncbi:hypothetical protein QS257_09320 [Terrilactibacillus sp. S3-3]|nr:hypothetical protein QS257_09320 [Terrilactibacillus sp. S3-3]